MLLESGIVLSSFVAIVAGTALPNYRRHGTTTTDLTDSSYDVVDIYSLHLVADRSDVDTDDLEDNEDTPDVDPELDLPSPDIDAIMSVDDSEFANYTYETGGLVRSDVGLSNSTREVSAQDVPWTCRKKAHKTNGDKVKGRGLKITNGDSVKRGFYIYQNSCDAVPYKYIWIPAGKTRFVQLPKMFEGRIVRGSNKWNLHGTPRLLGSWLEFSFDEHNVIWGDVSLIRGTDGAIAVWSTDAQKRRHKGFRNWILDGAPKKAYTKKPSGAKVIRPTEGKNAVINKVARDYIMRKVGAKKVYVDDSHAKPVINSQNGRFGVWFGRGRI